jgi:hypothetical protein
MNRLDFAGKTKYTMSYNQESREEKQMNGNFNISNIDNSNVLVFNDFR